VQLMICIEDKFRCTRRQPVYLESFAYRDHAAVDLCVSDCVVRQFRASRDSWIVKSHRAIFVAPFQYERGISDD